MNVSQLSQTNTHKNKLTNARFLQMSRGYKIKTSTKASTKALKPQFTLKKKTNCASSFNSQWKNKKNKIVSNVEQRITNFQMPQTNIEKKRSK
jgi:hypothetical protein